MATIEVEDIFFINGKGYVLTTKTGLDPQVGDYIGSHKILRVEIFKCGCFGNHAKEPSIALLVETEPKKGEKLEYVKN